MAARSSSSCPAPARPRRCRPPDHLHRLRRNTGANSSATPALRPGDLQHDLPTTRVTAGACATRSMSVTPLLATQTIRTPATRRPATRSVPNGVFDPAGYTFARHNLCRPDPRLRPDRHHRRAAAAAVVRNGRRGRPAVSSQADLDPGDRPRPVRRHPDLRHRTVGLPLGRHQQRGAINPAVLIGQPEEVQDYEIGVKAD